MYGATNQDLSGQQEMRHVIVTGADGFIGSRTASLLAQKGIEVLALGLRSWPEGIPLVENIRYLRCDLMDQTHIASDIPKKKYDVFFHFAWRGVNGPDKANPEVQISNIQMALRCAELAKTLGCRRILCAGTVAERSLESLPELKNSMGGMFYGAAKHCARLLLETYCKSVGLELIWMQFANIFGPGNKTGNLVSYTMERLAAGKNAEFGPAMQPYDFIYLGDLLEAIVRLGDCQTEESFFYIGSGAPRILKDYLETIGKLCGRSQLIRIAARPDDGIRYSMEMFDNKPLLDCIGQYVSMTFENGIIETWKDYCSSVAKTGE